MGGVENQEQYAPIHVDDDEQPTPQNQNTNGDPNQNQNPNGDTRPQGEEEGMKRKRQKTSKMWEGFNLLPPRDGAQKVQCKVCKSKYAYGESGTTTTFLRHMAKCKTNMDNEAKQNKLIFPPFADMDSGYDKLPSLRLDAKYDSNKMREAIATWVVGTEQPFVVVEVFRVKETLDKGAESENVFIKTMVTKMKEKFDKYWGECHLVMAIASVLDPRFNMKLVQFSFPSIYKEDAEKNIQKVKKALYEMYGEYLEIYDASVREAATPASGSGVNVGSEGTSLGSVWDAFGEFIDNEDLERPEKSELDMYLEEGVYRGQGKDSFKALEWWNIHKLKYPVLSIMAMDVLAIPISTVASESTFSAGGRVIDPYQSSLAPNTVEKLICGADWIRHRYRIKKKLKKEEIPTEVLLPTGEKKKIKISQLGLKLHQERLAFG